jgi:ATP-dependent protease HslVU (ClpYQ) peptidase subunit
MTTIVCDTKLKIMAADKRFSENNYKYRGEDKLVAVKDEKTGRVAFIGCAGTAREMIRFRAFFVEHMLGKEQWDISKRMTFPKLSMLVMLDTGETYEFDGDNTPMQVKARFHGVGSGRDFAIGALASGKSPKEAVRIASKYDNGTGHGITELQFE